LMTVVFHCVKNLRRRRGLAAVTGQPRPVPRGSLSLGFRCKASPVLESFDRRHPTSSPAGISTITGGGACGLSCSPAACAAAALSAMRRLRKPGSCAAARPRQG
jgi:hypothetical protein